ncbi:MAG: TonB-dependent receptor [Prevotellaceae bacterium]|jgi:TonB-linked SusC/RagA family outer membrane protein|nr:TonB-dependent receptor [Prevotellaceae bacterium]
MGMLCAQVSTSAVSGVVVDALDGTPVIGASVLVQGTSTGSPTNVDGQFSFHVDRFPVTLVVSYIGYKKQEVKVTSAMPLTITLQEDSEMLDDVVITGYQTFKKSAYAGSASQVKANKIADIPALSFTELLQGNATGVQFTSSSGQPGAATSLRIRGMGSFNASKSPLFVIDGVAVRSGDVDGLSTKSGLDIMSTISNDDIESVNIIKDAAAASLYGSRAANGVIIITTKKGKKGKAQVSLKADWGSSDYAMEYRPIMNGEQRRAYIYDALYRGQIAKNKSEADATAYADKKIDDYAPEPWCGYVNWDDILFRKGGHQNYEASVSGGSDKFTYYTSLSYTNQQGITTQSGLERISGRVNAEFQATDHLKLGANLLFSTVNQDANPEGTDYTSPFYSSRNAVVPSDPVYNEDGSWNRKFIRNEDRNPALSQAYDYRRQYIKRTFNTLFAEYEFIRDLKFRTTLSYDYNTTKSKSWSDPRTSNGKDTNGGMEGRFREYKKLVWKNQLSYATTIARDHNLDALIGYEIDDASSDYVYAYGTNFAVAGKNSLSNSVKPESVGGYPGTQRIVSYLAVANYNYLHRYYLGGSYRIDGTSRLHRDSRWGNFWSVSGAWRAIDEAFMEPARGWLNELKLRMSYGVNGTLPSDTFGFMGLSSLTDGYMGDPAISPKQIANYDLSWETNYAFNVGIDFGFIDRLTGSVEFYTRTTKNLLMDMPISRTTGFSSYLKNIGEVVNRGVEFELTSANFRTKDFEWSTTFNISHNANRVAKLSDQTRILSGNKIHTIGKPYNTYYLIEFAGINPETGAPQFYTNDTDEHGNLIKEVTEDNAKAKQIVVDKHAEPVVIGGLSNKFRIKWFDLSFLFSYQFGGYSFDTWAQKTEHGGKDLKANIPTYYAESWKKPGDVTNYEVFIESPKVAMHNVTTTRRLHSSDFIRLKTLTLGFNLPAAWTRTAGLSNVRLYASANNLLTWAAYNYYDPEAVDSNGGAVWGTPPLRTVTFGVSINL